MKGKGTCNGRLYNGKCGVSGGTEKCGFQHPQAACGALKKKPIGAGTSAEKK
jgi:hypothetical protein